MVTVKFKKLNENAKVPTRATSQAAGYDLYAQTTFLRQVIKSGLMSVIRTGIAVEIPKGYFGGIFARSGLATKKGLRLATGNSIIDSDYRGEILIPLYNDSNKGQIVDDGERIAQLIIIPYEDVEFSEVYELSATERGEGGFGSTNN